MTSSTTSAHRSSASLPGAVALVLGGALSLHTGAAIAATLFERAGPGGVVALRLGISALLLLAVFRPRLRGHSRSDWLVVTGFGVALAGMNSLIYEAIARIPLGIAITLEVLGPLVLSVAASRRLSSWLWAGLALGGVVLLGYGDMRGLDAGGVAFALAAGAMWAAYILLSARTGERFRGTEGLALAMTVAAAVTVPLGVLASGPALLEPVVIGLGAVVALLSSALPFSLEMAALRRMPAPVFAVLTSLGPAMAAVAGYLVLGQALGAVQVGGIGLVVLASAGAVGVGAVRGRRTDRAEPGHRAGISLRGVGGVRRASARWRRGSRRPGRSRCRAPSPG